MCTHIYIYIYNYLYMMSYNIHILYIMYMYIISEFIIYVYIPRLVETCACPCPLYCGICVGPVVFRPLHGPAEEDQGCTILVPWPQGHGEWPQAETRAEQETPESEAEISGPCSGTAGTARNGRGSTNWFCQKVTVWVKGETTFGCLETEEGFTLINYLFDFSLFLPTMDNSNFFF